MNIITKKVNPVGECDGCPKTNVDLYQASRGMMLCKECHTQEQETISKQKEVKSLLEESRKRDAEITSKEQIFVADTVPAIELRGLIENDETIPAGEKDYAFVKECETRYTTLKAAMFTHRQELARMEAEARIWQVNIQTTAVRLHGEIRRKYEQFDIEYKPNVTKAKTPVNKPVKTPTPKKKSFTKADLIELSTVCKKYGVGDHVFTVQSIVLNRNMSYDEAAKTLASKLGLIESV